MKEFQISSSDGLMLKGKHWARKGEAKAVVQIVHGMAEHILRYDGFARVLVEHGFEVYGHSHRGHGDTAKTKDQLGYFAKKDGWDLLVEDVLEVTGLIRESSPGLPIIILGHSMGSFAVRDILRKQPHHYAGAVIVGSGWVPRAGLVAAKAVSRLLRVTTGSKRRSNLMNFLLFGHYNNEVPNSRTEFDWLSRDHEMVSAYVEDPLCGFVCTTSFYDDLITGAMQVMRKSGLEKVPKDLPILIISGDEDPVGQYGKGVKKLKQSYVSNGLTQVTLKLFPEGRHEILNEINRLAVYEEICSWLVSEVLEMGGTDT